MQKLKSSSRVKDICALEKKHLNLFSVLAVLIFGGIILALSASAAGEWPFDVGDGGPGASDRSLADGMEQAKPASGHQRS